MIKLKKTQIGKILRFIGSMIALVITTFFAQSCIK